MENFAFVWWCEPECNVNMCCAYMYMYVHTDIYVGTVYFGQ